MRVSRIQAEKNRQTVIDVASRLFREHGFDGIGLKDLMESAGLTQGAFYKQFASKDDLAAQASRRALESASHRWSAAAAANPQDPLGAVIAFYLSHGALRGKAGRLPDRCARLGCCPAGRRREGVIRSRDQGTSRSPRPYGRRDEWQRAQEQGHGHSLDDGRCADAIARRQRPRSRSGLSGCGSPTGSRIRRRLKGWADVLIEDAAALYSLIK